MTYRLSKIGADGAQLAADFECAPVVRVDRDLLAHPIFVANVSPPKRLNWQEANVWAQSLTTNNWAWRLASVEETFLICDHNRYAGGVLDPAFFDQIEREPYKADMAWTSTRDPENPGNAFSIDFHHGYSYSDREDDQFLARAVRASQSI